MMRASAMIFLAASGAEPPLTRRSISQPTAVGTSRLFLGRAASHGIIEGLRFRAGESTFDTLPAGDFAVILQTTAGVQKYPVSETDRATLLPACNER